MRRFTVLPDREITSSCSAAFSPITTPTISSAAGRIKSSPMVCGFPVFAIILATRYDASTALAFSLPVTYVDCNLMLTYKSDTFLLMQCLMTSRGPPAVASRPTRGPWPTLWEWLVWRIDWYLVVNPDLLVRLHCSSVVYWTVFFLESDSLRFVSLWQEKRCTAASSHLFSDSYYSYSYEQE